MLLGWWLRRGPCRPPPAEAAVWACRPLRGPPRPLPRGRGRPRQDRTTSPPSGSLLGLTPKAYPPPSAPLTQGTEWGTEEGEEEGTSCLCPGGRLRAEHSTAMSPPSPGSVSISGAAPAPGWPPRQPIGPKLPTDSAVWMSHFPGAGDGDPASDLDAPQTTPCSAVSAPFLRSLQGPRAAPACPERGQVVAGPTCGPIGAPSPGGGAVPLTCPPGSLLHPGFPGHPGDCQMSGFPL